MMSIMTGYDPSKMTDGQLAQAVQTGDVTKGPMHSLLSEIAERNKLRQLGAADQAQAPRSTVASEQVNALLGRMQQSPMQHPSSGGPGPQMPPPTQPLMPMGGVGSVPSQMAELAPQGVTNTPVAPMPTNLAQGPQVAQQSGIQGMAQGGIIRGFADGKGFLGRYQNYLAGVREKNLGGPSNEAYGPDYNPYGDVRVAPEEVQPSIVSLDTPRRDNSTVDAVANEISNLGREVAEGKEAEQRLKAHNYGSMDDAGDTDPNAGNPYTGPAWNDADSIAMEPSGGDHPTTNRAENLGTDARALALLNKETGELTPGPKSPAAVPPRAMPTRKNPSSVGAANALTPPAELNLMDVGNANAMEEQYYTDLTSGGSPYKKFQDQLAARKEGYASDKNDAISNALLKASGAMLANTSPFFGPGVGAGMTAGATSYAADKKDIKKNEREDFGISVDLATATQNYELKMRGIAQARAKNDISQITANNEIAKTKHQYKMDIYKAKLQEKQASATLAEQAHKTDVTAHGIDVRARSSAANTAAVIANSKRMAEKPSSITATITALQAMPVKTERDRANRAEAYKLITQKFASTNGISQQQAQRNLEKVDSVISKRELALKDFNKNPAAASHVIASGPAKGKNLMDALSDPKLQGAANAYIKKIATEEVLASPAYSKYREPYLGAGAGSAAPKVRTYVPGKGLI